VSPINLFLYNYNLSFFFQSDLTILKVEMWGMVNNIRELPMFKNQLQFALLAQWLPQGQHWLLGTADTH